MLKTFLSDTNIVLADIDEPANVNGYSKYFPNVFRGIRTLGTARELRGEVNSWGTSITMKLYYQELLTM